MQNGILILSLLIATAGCSAGIVGSGDRAQSGADRLDSAACDGAGGICTSFAFSGQADACGGATEIAESCGVGTFRVCCPRPLTTQGKLTTVDVSMPKAAMKFFTDNALGDHHLGWHESRDWDSLDPSDQDWLTQNGFARAAHQEGEPGNGLEFLAMHRFVLQTLRTLPELASSRALFDGWKRVPDNRDPMLAATGPDSLAANPAMNIRQVNMSNEMRAMIAMCQDTPEQLAQFATDDAFGLYVETATLSNAPGAGLHNYLHNRYATAASAVNMGDPKVNMGNQIFWRLHGWIDNCWTRYRKVTHQRDDDPAYVAAMAKGAMDMNLVAKTPTKKGKGQ